MINIELPFLLVDGFSAKVQLTISKTLLFAEEISITPLELVLFSNTEFSINAFKPPGSKIVEEDAELELSLLFLNSELLTVTLEFKTSQIHPNESVLFINLVFSTKRLPFRLRIKQVIAPVPELLINSQSLMDKLPAGLLSIIIKK